MVFIFRSTPLSLGCHLVSFFCHSVWSFRALVRLEITCLRTLYTYSMHFYIERQIKLTVYFQTQLIPCSLLLPFVLIVT